MRHENQRKDSFRIDNVGSSMFMLFVVAHEVISPKCLSHILNVMIWFEQAFIHTRWNWLKKSQTHCSIHFLIQKFSGCAFFYMFLACPMVTQTQADKPRKPESGFDFLNTQILNESSNSTWRYMVFDAAVPKLQSHCPKVAMASTILLQMQLHTSKFFQNKKN